MEFAGFRGGSRGAIMSTLNLPAELRAGFAALIGEFGASARQPVARRVPRTAWPVLTFGKHEGKTLVQAVLTDPDWVFWAHGQGALKHVPRADELCLKARNIRIPAGRHGPKVADYVMHFGRKLSHVEVGYAADMDRSEDRGVLRRPVLDLSVAHATSNRDKLGSRVLLDVVKAYVFMPKGWRRVTKDRGEAFFNDDSNFALPADYGKIQGVPSPIRHRQKL